MVYKMSGFDSDGDNTSESADSEENAESHKFEYPAFKIEHRESSDAQQLYVSSIDAHELTKWSDVPRKGSDYMEGYQRQLDENRVEGIKGYFELDKNNIIPGAILVSIDSNSVEITDNGEGVYNVSIEYNEDVDIDDLISEKFTELYSRLDEAERKYVDEDDNDEEEEVPESYLARVTKDLKRANNDFDRFPPEDQEAIEQFVRSTAKPGLILDGQHRVWGARHVPEDIELPIVLMPGIDKSEQVFHFYIVNNKAEPLSKEQLLITLATSLTDGEVSNLFDRLDEAGVDAEEARLTYRADTSPKSPFAGLVDYGGAVGEQTGAFKYKSLHDVIRNFLDLDRNYQSLTEDVDEWDSDEDFTYRMDRFYIFWDEIQTQYNDLWNDAISAIDGEEFDDKPEQFFYKVTMTQLQEYVLDHMNRIDDFYRGRLDAGPILSTEENIRDSVEDAVSGLDAQFFRREWEVKSLDTSDGRELFQQQLSKADGLAVQHLHTLTMFRGV